MTTKNPYAIATESFVPTGRPPDRVAYVISLLGISGLGAGSDLSGGSQMDKMEVEANPPGVGDALALVDVVNWGVYSKAVVSRHCKSIGYRALKNRVHSLWSPIGELNIIDLDNEYYLIRFAMDADYDKVLSGGPWMKYDCYLTVQPWSRDFSTAASYPKQILSWLRLLGLPYRYYSKSLFKVIAILLGEVIRIDFNTDDGRRGCFARLAVVVNLDRPLIHGIYGHSKEVCGQTEAVIVPPALGCKSEPPTDGRFGPWMQVTNRKRRPDIARQGLNNEGPSVVLKGGSQFKALDLLWEDNQRNASGMEQDSGREPNTQGMGATVQVSSVVGEVEGSAQAVVDGVVHSIGRLREVVQVNPVMVDEGCDGSGDGHVEQPCWEEIVVSPMVTAKGKVVREPSSLQADKHSVVRIIEEGNSRVLRENNGQPLYGSICSNYAKWVKRSLIASKALPQKDVRSKKKNELGSEQLVVADWASKFASSLNMGTMAASSSVVNDVNNVFVVYPWVVFRCSFSTKVFYYIHFASPDSSRRSALWGRLRVLDPGLAHPWILGGDFSIICSSSEWHGGSVRRSGVCPRFCDFLFQFGLLDIGRTPVVHNGDRHPFRFLSILNDHPDFDRLLRESWDSDVAMFDNLMSFQGKNRLWNKEMFGHIGRRKAHVLARIKGVEPTPVASFLDSNGCWDWIRLARVLPQAELDKIAGVVPPHASYGGDKPGWRWEENRLFSTSSASNGLWNVAWRLKVPQRVRVLFWLLFNNKLLTNVERNRRHLTDVATCLVCGQGDETVDHVLRGCGCSRRIWNNLLRNDRLHSFLSMPFTEWITINIQDTGNMVSLEPAWPSLFSITCWLLWKRRCCLFLGSDPNCYGDVISFCRRFQDEVVSASTRHASNVRPRAGMCWLPSPRGWVKVNVDGAVGDSPVMATSGGVIRDEAGEWLLGFAHSIGSCSILCDELWDAFDSLLLAWQRGFRKVILELDNMQVVLILNGESSALGDNLLVVRIKELLVRQWDVRVRHIVREANKVVDGLARLVRGEPIGEWFYDIPPLEVSGLLVND
ncbi:hypothetical protein GQ457_11G022230 [Hibiscus cannabinus]